MRRLGSLWLLVVSHRNFGQGGGAGGGSTPATPVMATMPTFKAVNGPGAMFPALQPFSRPTKNLRASSTSRRNISSPGSRRDNLTQRVSSSGAPSDSKKFSGIVVAEPMHPTGNDWMFYFLHTYLMSQGHVAVEIVTGSLPLFKYRKRGTLQRPRDRKHSGQRDSRPGGVAAEERPARRVLLKDCRCERWS